MSKLEKKNIEIFTEQAYLDYSMSVILDRALPHIADGLKPVQRRIIYAMSQLGLDATSKFKKSARTVGDVLGKFHPHSDTACYEAMVLMAQDFSYRYPLVDGQGNWGTADSPRSFAAMRYTESRLTKYAEALLVELSMGTVDWQPNFDGSLQEPKLLPARLPNVLLNGSTGIAVGMSTDIPPHNLNEVVDALILLLDNPKTQDSEIYNIIKAPDYATGAEIISSKDDIQAVYASGGGSIKARAVYHTEANKIIITALPYMVSGSKVQEQIAAQMVSKKVPQIVDIQDESNYENPTRLVISLRSNRVDANSTMLHLFATTELEKSYRVNLNMIGLDNKPRIYNLRGILEQWLEYRTLVVTKRLEFRLNKLEQRLEILAGLLIAYLNLDEVIRIIRYEDNAKFELIKKFKLSDRQAEAILELKLKYLSRLEETKITSEEAELKKEQQKISTILASKSKLKKLIKNELEQDKKLYGDARRSEVVVRKEAIAIETNNVSIEPITVILSVAGWIRAAKGHDIDAKNLNYKSGDKFLSQLNTDTGSEIILLDSNGKSYSLHANTLPSARGYGEPVTAKVKPAPQASFPLMLTSKISEVLLLNNGGYGFIISGSALSCKNKAGKSIMSLPEKAKMLIALDVENKEYLCLITNDGRMLVIKSSEIPKLNKGKGKKLIGVTKAELESNKSYVTVACMINPKQTLYLKSSKGNFKLTYSQWQDYISDAGKRGNKMPRGHQKITSCSTTNSD